MEKHADLLNIKYKEEARRLGYTFIGRIKNLGKYHCNKCNDYFDYYISGMRKMFEDGLKVNCPCCFKNELLAVQKDMDTSKIEFHSRGTYTFKYNKCGHVQTQKLHSLLKRESKKCFECVEEDHKITADNRGLVFLGKAGTKMYNYSFKDCGHIRALSCTDVRQGNFKCTECFKIKLEKEAISSNLILVGEPENKNANYRQYKTLCCGNTQDIITGNVRFNAWVCHNCKTTAFNLPSSLYLLKLTSPTTSWLKLGYSKNIKSRIIKYGLIPEIQSDILYSFDAGTGENAVKIEKKIHKKYYQLRIDPEVMRPFFINSGFTECYPLSMLHLLLEELHKVKELKEVKDLYNG